MSCWTRRDLSRNNLRMMRLLGIALTLLVGAAPAAQTPDAAGGAIQGVVSTQSGAIPLGGVLVSLSQGTADVATATSEGDGTFRFEGLKPGQYRVTAKMEGFEPMSAPVAVSTGGT